MSAVQPNRQPAPAICKACSPASRNVAASPAGLAERAARSAVERVSALTVPTTRDEEWRFTDLSPLTKVSFQPAHAAIKLQRADIERFHIEEATTRLVFVDGVYAPELSSVSSCQRHRGRATWQPRWPSNAALIEPHLGRTPAISDNVFAALNTAFLHDGALIMLPRDVAANSARASAVHRDAERSGELSALPGAGRHRQRGDGDRRLCLAAGRSLFHQCRDRDCAGRQCARPPCARAARKRQGLPHRQLRGLARRAPATTSRSASRWARGSRATT